MSELADALRGAKTRRMFFAFVAKGTSDGALLVSKSAIPKPEIDAAKKSTGGSSVFKGRCFGEDGVTVFELPKEPPGSLAQQLRKIIARDAKMTLNVETRIGGEEEEGTGTETEETPGQPTAVTFKARLKEVSPLYQDAGKKAPERKPDLDKTATAAAAAYKAGDFATGLSHLDNLESTSRQILESGTAPPTETPAVAATTPATDATVFKVRLKEVTPLYQEAAKKAPERKPDLDKTATEAVAAYKAGDFTTGLSRLDNLEAVSKEILSGGAAAEKPATDDAKAAFKTRLQEVSPVYQEAAKAAPDQKAALDGLAAQAVAAAKAKDYPQAMKLLDELAASAQQALEPPAPALDKNTFKARMQEVLPVYMQAVKQVPDSKTELQTLANQSAAAGKEKNYAEAIDLLDRLEARSRRVMRDAEVKDFANTAGKGTVAFRKKMIDWKASKTKARAGITSLQKSILGDADLANLSDWAFIKTAANRLPELVDSFDQFDAELTDALSAIDDVSDVAERKSAKDRAAAVVGKYRKEVEKPIYAILDNEAYGGIKVAEFIRDELTSLSGVLAS